MYRPLLRILLVEDSPDDAFLLSQSLKDTGMALETNRVETAEAFLTALHTESWDVILSDQTLPTFSATAALRLLQESGQDIPFIIVSGTLGEEAAVAAMKAGADDFFIKGQTSRLPAAIERELKDAAERRDRRRQRAMTEALSDIAATLTSTLDLDAVLQRILQNADRVVPYDAANLMLVHRNRVTPAYWKDYPSEFDEQFRALALPLNWHPFHTMATAREPLWLDEGDENPIWRSLPGHEWVGSTLSAPVVTHERLLGFLNLHSRQHNFYTTEHAARLAVFANQAATALHNAQLYAAAQQHADGLEQRVRERTEQLRLAKEHVESILNSTSDGIFLSTPDGRITQTNAAFVSLFGETRGALANLSQMAQGEHADTLRQALAEVITGRRPVRIEVVCRKADGVSFDADIALSPVKAFWTQQANVIGSVRDMTQRRQLEADLRDALEKEKELLALKTRFVSMISHEFRTPLATIQSSSDLLKRYQARMGEERRLQQLDSIQTQIRHLTQLLDDILTISRAESVGMEFLPAPMNLSDFCARLVDDFRPIAADHQFIFETDCDCHAVPADSQLLRRAVINLLSNAAKYSPPGSPIYVYLSHHDRAIRLTVQDFGVGIPAEDMPRLFEIFHRGRNVGNISGTGLGLAITKLAVEAHGGTIEVDSKPGAGTRFTVVLPTGENGA